MKILIAPDSFKGSLSAAEVCDIISESLSDIDGIETVSLPLSDGGEGFGNCCCDCCKGDIIYDRFSDIYGNTISAPVYFCKDIAVLNVLVPVFCRRNEMLWTLLLSAQASRLVLLTKKDTENSSSVWEEAECATAAQERLRLWGRHFMIITTRLSPFPQAKI